MLSQFSGPFATHRTCSGSGDGRGSAVADGCWYTRLPLVVPPVIRDSATTLSTNCVHRCTAAEAARPEPPGLCGWLTR